MHLQQCGVLLQPLLARSLLPLRLSWPCVQRYGSSSLRGLGARQKLTSHPVLQVMTSHTILGVRYVLTIPFHITGSDNKPQNVYHFPAQCMGRPYPYSGVSRCSWGPLSSLLIQCLPSSYECSSNGLLSLTNGI